MVINMVKLIILLLFGIICVNGKFHHLQLKDETRRNILLTKFGFDNNGTLEFSITNFTVPTAVYKNSEADKFGIIGFSLSRGHGIMESTRLNPHLCHLNQRDQDYEALFFVFEFETSALSVFRSGGIKDIRLCPDLETCLADPDSITTPEPPSEPGILKKIFLGAKNKHTGTPYLDYIPLNETNNEYSFKFVIKFNETQQGFYHLIYHNCFNYKEIGYSNRVAVDLTIDITEMNRLSHLSAGDIPKPQLYVFVSFLFALVAILWMNLLCKSESKNIYFVHKLMTFLVILKVLSTFCHGTNYYFLSLYGQEREIWMYLYFATHLLKGLLLFGTLILIGTGYTFFKNFLTQRDRNIILLILPLQVIDNIASVVLEESELASQQYVFWFEVFILLDLLCCAFVLFPIVWSIRHLQESAGVDGKEFNLKKIKLFKQFYLVVIFYIYSTRMGGFFLDRYLPYNLEWISGAMNELITLWFFVYVGAKFRPLKTNIYLKLSQSDSDAEEGEAITMNGLYENVVKLSRTNALQNEIDELIPGTIAGNLSNDSDSGDDDDSLLPKFSH